LWGRRHESNCDRAGEVARLQGFAEGYASSAVIPKRRLEAVGATEQSASTSPTGDRPGLLGSEAVVQETMLSEQGEPQRGERGVDEIDDDDLRRDEQPSELCGRHRFYW
jgi:hypothetical protein